MIIDKLYKKVSEMGNVCVGLDSDLSYIPFSYYRWFERDEEALFNYNKRIIDETIDVAACYKVQIAYYEALGIMGLRVYKNTVAYIRSLGAIVIGDVKRGDIKDTAKKYAKAHFEGEFEVDFITVNPYMGLDSLDPYLNYVENDEKGIFTLVRTSNMGAHDIQFLEDKSGKKVYDIVGEKVQKLGEKYMGESGYSSIGGVMGLTHKEEAKEIRERLNKTFFLVPGYGAQGGKAEDVSLLLKNGNGAVVNSSRGILLAYKKEENRGLDFAKCARYEAIKMRDEIIKASR
ncbi:MAG: orotidine-5'-phosphate decarboxylase [Clostridiaceae bacterium]